MTNFFTFSPVNISSALIVFNLLAAFFASFFIAFIYRKTHSGLSYSQSFFITLVMVAPITVVVIMVVQNNLYGALGLLGAFALIRFRTIVKETRDVSFLFFSLAEGVAVGTGHYSVALISTIMISLAAMILARWKFGSAGTSRHILMLASAYPLLQSNIDDLAKSFRVSMRLLSSKKIADDYEYTYSVQAKNPGIVEQYLTVLQKNTPIKNYDLISGKDTVEY